MVTHIPLLVFEKIRLLVSLVVRTLLSVALAGSFSVNFTLVASGHVLATRK